MLEVNDNYPIIFERDFMKAIVYERYGSPDVLEVKEVEKPAPKDNEVLIKIYATTVNRTDCGFRKPEYPVIIRLINGLFKPKKKILGSELAGEVESIGKDVTLFKKGDKVFGLAANRFGAHAEYICLPENGSIVTKPDNISYEEAAAVCDGLMLAYNYIGKINSPKGKKILIYGASGSIGSAAVQLAKYFGIEVTAVCNTKNLELVKSLGANKVIDYTKNDFTKDDQIYDVILDAVGKITLYQCRNLLKNGGIFYSTDFGFLAQNLFLTIVTSIFGKTPCGKKVLFPLPKDSKEDVSFFKQLLETGNYKAVIDRTYPLEQIVEAYKYVETEQKTGNVVIKLVSNS